MGWTLLIASGLGAGVMADRIATVECRSRGFRRPLRTVLVAVATAALFTALGHSLRAAPVLPAYLWFAAVTTCLALVDLCEHRIPNRILFPGTAVTALLLIGGALLEDGPIVRAMGAGAVYFALLYVTGALGRGGIGAGDVKLSFLLGMVTGYRSWGSLVVAVVAAFVIGGVAAIVAIVAGHHRRTDAIAFGPALVLGAYAGVLAGIPIATWYLAGWA